MAATAAGLTGGGECGAARCFAEPRDLKTATFDLLFEVKQLAAAAAAVLTLASIHLYTT